MTGWEHYSEAERLIELANGINPVSDPLAADATIALAQVHATLALAAATAATQATAYDGDEQHQRSRGWAGVT